MNLMRMLMRVSKIIKAILFLATLIWIVIVVDITLLDNIIVVFVTDMLTIDDVTVFVLMNIILPENLVRWSIYFIVAWIGVFAYGIVSKSIKKKIEGVRIKRFNAEADKEFVCPYCFETHFVQDVRFRCTNLRCADVEDTILTRYEGGNISMPLKAKNTFEPPLQRDGTVPEHAQCPMCHRETTKIICPSCHNVLPESSLTGQDTIISIIGSRDVGKSHFIGVIIKELLENIAGKFDANLTAFGDTMERYEEHFGRRLYLELSKLDLTQSSTVSVNNGAYKPFIFTLSIAKRSKIKNFTLVFFDTAGEDLKQFDTINTLNRYIYKSAGIIFLLDPMQIGSVREWINKSVVAQASSITEHEATRPDDILARVSKLIRGNLKVESSKKINIPMAVVLSKFDVMAPRVSKNRRVLAESPHTKQGAFVWEDCYEVDAEIRAMIEAWGTATFAKQLSINYKNYAYFASSALGFNNNPRSDNHINYPKPHRIEDSLLWILSSQKIIKTKGWRYFYVIGKYKNMVMRKMKDASKNGEAK